MKVAIGKLPGGVFGALGVVFAFGILSVSGATAKSVTVGQLFTPTEACTNPGTALVTGVASGRSYVAPKPGVIISWSFRDGATPVMGLKLRVGRSLGSARYKIVGGATAGTQKANAVNNYRAHIPVKAGDLIGVYVGGAGDCLTVTGNSLDTYAWAPHVNVAPGRTVPFAPLSDVKFPVSVRVREDCVVPSLKGEALRAATKTLKAASCSLGAVRPRGQTRGKVKRQKPAAGKVLAPGAKVNVWLR